jgi:protein-S-isoprenylcysteine O-methyltransferase Ste14
MLLLVVFWQISTYSIASPQGILRWLLHAIYFLSIAGLLWGVLALRSFDTFGIYPILRYLRCKEEPPPLPLVICGPYRWVRHPLYLFCLLSIWSCPNLTADRLLFNILWTLWIIVGTILEERDLVDSFGEDYREYQRKVPMLIPFSIRPLQ